MKASIALVVLGLLGFAACSADDGAQELSFELTEIDDSDAEVYTFEASGDTVEEGLMCTEGDHIWQGNETTDGEVMTDQMLEELSEAGQPWEMVVVSEYACDDGSGSIVVAKRLTVDLDSIESAGEVIGTWTVRSGEVDGTAISGAGDVTTEGALTGFLSAD